MCFPYSLKACFAEVIPWPRHFLESMVADLKREVLHRTAHFQKAEKIFEGWVSFWTEHAAQALLVYLQLPGNIGDGFCSVQIVRSSALPVSMSSIKKALVASTINSPLKAGADLTRAMTVSLKSLVSGIFPISLYGCFFVFPALPGCFDILRLPFARFRHFFPVNRCG